MRSKLPEVLVYPPRTREAINANTQLYQAIQDSAANCSFVRFNHYSLRVRAVENLKAINGQIAARKHNTGYSVDNKEMAIINSLKIYYDSEGIKALAAKLEWKSFADKSLGEDVLKGFITKFVKVKLGLHDPSADDKKQLELLAPYINLTFQTPKNSEFQRDRSETRITDNSPSLACLNHLPDFEKTTSHHFQYYTWPGTRKINRNKTQELYGLFKSNNRLLLRTAIAEGKSCCFLQPSAFLSALHDSSGGVEKQQELVKTIWNESVIVAMKEYENHCGTIPTPTFVIGDEYLSLSGSGLKSEIYQIANYDISKLDRELRGCRRSNGIMNPLMANHSSMIGNGAMGNGAARAAEEYFVRTHPASLYLKLADERIVDYWVGNAHDISRIPARVPAAATADARMPVAAPARMIPFAAAPGKILPAAVDYIVSGMNETYAYFSNFGDLEREGTRRNFVKEIVKAQDATRRNNSHFDWWVFPVNSSSSGYDWKYAVGDKEIAQLLANQNFMTKYQVMINTYFSAMGWDIHNNKKIDDRNFLTQKEINPTRLAKCLHSMKIFGLVDRHNSAVSFMEQSGLRPEGWGLHDYGKSHGEAAKQAGTGGRYEWCAGEFVDGFMIFRDNEEFYRHIDDRRVAPIRGAGAIPQRRAAVVAPPADAVESDIHSSRMMPNKQEITLYPNRYIDPNTSVVASLYHSVGSGYWEGNGRAGNFRAVDKVYSGEEDIKNTFIAAVICAAAECGINKFSEIIATINKAKQYGGLSNIPADVEDAQDITQNRKNLSAIYQDICQQVGLLTGRKTEELKTIEGKPAAVGSRLTFFLDAGIVELRKLETENKDNAARFLQWAEQSIARKSEKVRKFARRTIEH